jgi:hypothetical protein
MEQQVEQQLRLQQQLQLQEGELMRERLVSQQISQLALAERHRAEAEWAAAEQLAQERQIKLQQLEAESARQQRQHEEQVLQFEASLLAQSSARERELQAQLRELDEQFEEVEVADSRNRIRAVEVAELSASWSSEMERGLHASPSGSAVDGMTKAINSPVAPSRTSPIVPKMVEAASLVVAAARPVPRLADKGSASLDLPQGLPRVYEAAVSIILHHGWQVLHGGENAGPAWTALHWAASEGRLDVCELLLSAKADQGHLDELGKTALAYALENGQRATAAILSSATLADAVQAEVEQSVLSANWSPSFSEASPGLRLVAPPLLAVEATWPRDEQQV